MSYDPLGTDSRSNSPVPFSRSAGQQPPRHRYGYDQTSAGESPSASGSPYLQHSRPYPSIAAEQDPLSSHGRNPFQEPSSSNSSPSFRHQQQFHPLQQQQQQQQHQHQHPSPYGDSSKNSSYNSAPQPGASPFMATLRSQQLHGLGAAGTASSVGSFDDRRQDNGSSHRSSAHNLALNTDRHYNITQTDATLEGLTERWNAYQAWWAKQYKEQPFYRIWTRSKWVLLISTTMLMGYSAAGFAYALGFMLDHFEHSAVVMEFHSNMVYLTLAASIFGIISALVGFVGIFRENRIWLSWYSVMLWAVFALYLAVGYIAFRRQKNHLRAHLRDEWIHDYTRDQRLIVQRNLKCCGYQGPIYYGEYDMRCFPMTNLPGCQHKYNLYEDNLLSTCWTASFILVPFQLFVMVAALLCSNHVDGMLRSGRPGLKSFKTQ